MKPVRTPDGAVDPVQTALAQMREESSSPKSSSLVEMTERLKNEKVESPAWTWWDQFVYDCRNLYWGTLDLFVEWRRTVNQIKKIAVAFGLFMAVLLGLFFVKQTVRHWLYPNWIEPTEEASLIFYHRTHCFTDDEVFALQARMDAETTNLVWMKKETNGTNWYPFYNFDQP